MSAITRTPLFSIPEETIEQIEQEISAPTQEMLAARARLSQIHDDLSAMGFIHEPQTRAQGPSLFGRFITCLQELPMHVIRVCDRMISFSISFFCFTCTLVAQSYVDIYRAITRPTPQPPKPVDDPMSEVVFVFPEAKSASA